MEITINQYGTPMKLTHAGQTREIKGFFQSVRGKSKQSALRADSALGEISQGLHIYIGSRETAVSEGDLLEVEGERYVFCRVAPIYYRDDSVYTWGICMQEGAI